MDALLDEHLSWGEQLIETRALELVKNAGERPLRDVLAEMVGVMLELHAEEPKLHRVLSSEAARAGAAPRVTALEERATTLIGALLSSHPDVRVADVSLAARVVVQIIDALTHRWIIEPAGEPVPLHKLSRELTAVLTSYLSAPS